MSMGWLACGEKVGYGLRYGKQRRRIEYPSPIIRLVLLPPRVVVLHRLRVPHHHNERRSLRRRRRRRHPEAAGGAPALALAVPQVGWLSLAHFCSALGFRSPWSDEGGGGNVPRRLCFWSKKRRFDPGSWFDRSIGLSRGDLNSAVPMLFRASNCDRGSINPRMAANAGLRNPFLPVRSRREFRRI
jgi:hypothetical protein